MKILVVEDDRKIAKFIKHGLEKEGYEVDVEHNGESGFQRVQEDVYGLVILDLVLEGKDGLTLVRDLRAKRILTPILIVTVKDTLEDVVAGLYAGADDYLKKPFAFIELMARVKALLRRAEAERGAKLHYADLCLDPVLHKAWRSENPIDLTAREYDLLEYLVRNAEQVVTRNMIADEVWKEQFDKFTNIIDVYVNYLRKKVDRGQEKKLIRTVRGVGYILKEEG